MRSRHAAFASGLLTVGALSVTMAQAPELGKPGPDRAATQAPPPSIPAPPSPYLKVEVQGLSPDEARKVAEETREAMRHAQKDIQSAGVAIPSALATLQGTPVELFLSGRDTRLDADYDDVALKTALSQLFAAARTDYLVDSDVDTSQKVVLKAKNVRLISALQALADQAGVVWTTEIVHRNGDKQYRLRYHVSTSRPRPFVASTGNGSVYSSHVPTAIADIPPQTLRGAMWTYNVAELRQTFRCPHCKNHITTVRPKGQRIAQASWRFCPFCGKPVDMEDEDSDERASDNVLIEPGARVKIEVTSEPEDKEYHGTYAVDPSGNLRFRLMPVSATSARVTTVKQSVRENFPHQLILSFNVTGFTTDKLEKELETRLRTWFKDPRVSAAVISRK